MEKNCAFQFAYTRDFLFADTKIICDESELTMDEATALWEKHKPEVIKILKNKDDYKSMEAVLWVDMEDKHSYGKHSFYITIDNETDGKNIWENKREYIL